jgi:hypothetical protein
MEYGSTVASVRSIVRLLTSVVDRIVVGMLAAKLWAGLMVGRRAGPKSRARDEAAQASLADRIVAGMLAAKLGRLDGREEGRAEKVGARDEVDLGSSTCQQPLAQFRVQTVKFTLRKPR